MRKKLFAYALSGALSLGAIGGTITYAAETTDTETTAVETAEQTERGLEDLDEATKTKVQEIRTQVQEELEALGVTFPEKGDKGDRGDRGDRFADLDEADKTKAEAILKQLKEDAITQEEAQEQLEALGVTLPAKTEKGDRFADLDEATKAKAEAIQEQVKDGSLTREEAQAQFEALGVSMPDKGEKPDLFADLDEATKAEAEAIVEEAEAELTELGAEGSLFGKGHHHGMDRK